MAAEVGEFIIDVTEDCNACLHQAAYDGEVGRLEWMLNTPECQPFINSKIRPFLATPLRLAATAGHADCVECLLWHGASVDMIDIKAQTPLFVAIKNHRLECARLLLVAGANPSGHPGNNTTPLYIACHDGYIAGVQLLLQFGAQTETFDSPNISYKIYGWPLQTAAIYHHLQTFLTLLCYGAVADIRNVKPELPAQLMARSSVVHSIIKHRAPVEFLQIYREFGGNLWQQDPQGRYATEIPGDAAVVALLRDLMGMPLKLMSLCRYHIRQCLGRSRLHFISSLPLPLCLIKYLAYEDMTVKGRPSVE